jgi:hypothetical protein
MGESECEGDGNRDDAMSVLRGPWGRRCSPGSGPSGFRVAVRGWGPRLRHVLGPSAVGVW